MAIVDTLGKKIPAKTGEEVNSFAKSFDQLLSDLTNQGFIDIALERAVRTSNQAEKSSLSR